jgi:hypothetical protein
MTINRLIGEARKRIEADKNPPALRSLASPR